MIINPIYDSPILNLEAQELENLLNLYGLTHDNLSEEGLGKLLQNIAISFADFIVRIKNNMASMLKDSFKDIKRSVLTITIQNNKFGISRLYSTEYSLLNNTIVPSYPFRKPPLDIINFMIETFTTFDMDRRMASLIDNYMKIGSFLAINDLNNVEACIKNIDILNVFKSGDVSQYLLNIVSTDSKKTTFGAIFDSVGDFKDAIDLTLTQAPELEKAIVIGRTLDRLYNTFSKVHDSVIKTKNNNVDLHRISGLAAIMNDTGVLIEQYAMLVKEYHHLEFWLNTVVEETLKSAKK
jgi:hypothetical protein